MIIIAARRYHPRDDVDYLELGDVISHIVNRVAWDILLGYLDEYRVTDDERLEEQLEEEAAGALEEELSKLFVVRRRGRRVYVFAPDDAVRVVDVALWSGLDGGTPFDYIVVNANVALVPTPATIELLEWLIDETPEDYNHEVLLVIDDDSIKLEQREVHGDEEDWS